MKRRAKRTEDYEKGKQKIRGRRKREEKQGKEEWLGGSGKSKYKK